MQQVDGGQLEGGVIIERTFLREELFHRGGSRKQRRRVDAESGGGDEPSRAKHGITAADRGGKLHHTAPRAAREGAEDAPLRVRYYKDVGVALSVFQQPVAVPEELRHRLRGGARFADADERRAAAFYAFPDRKSFVWIGIVRKIELRLPRALVVKTVQERLVQHQVPQRGAAYADLYHAVITGKPAGRRLYILNGRVRQRHPAMSRRAGRGLREPALRRKRRRAEIILQLRKCRCAPAQ
ncbi:hypothetical protein SDC9_160383 [bioreactor metagenome]|uniref:Uncharacterized protein n=1 Tax=bioreactor metagenome TaxID=1076179 RepID=A0A645FLI5_9ZZZZ